MILTRYKVYHRTGRYGWTWMYRLEGIPDSRFSSSEGSKAGLLDLAKRKYPNESIIDKTKS